MRIPAKYVLVGYGIECHFDEGHATFYQPASEQAPLSELCVAVPGPQLLGLVRQIECLRGRSAHHANRLLVRLAMAGHRDVWPRCLKVIFERVQQTQSGVSLTVRKSFSR